MCVVSWLSLFADGALCWWRRLPSLLEVFVWGHISYPQEPTECAAASLRLAFHALLRARARVLLIHVFLPFVMYGEKGRMNGQSLIGGADDAPPGPLWTDPFGNKAVEAAHEGFARLNLTLAHGPPEQVRFLRAASVSGTSWPALQALVCLFWIEHGIRGAQALLSGEAWAELDAQGPWSRKSCGTHLGLNGGLLSCS